MIYAKYDESGKITAWREINPDEDGGELLALYRQEENLAEWNVPGVTAATHYVDVVTGTITERPPMDLGVSGNVITRIPKGATLRIGDQIYAVDDGQAEIEGYSGAVKITCWPYQDAEVQIT